METNELHNIILEQLRSKQPLWSNWMIGEKIGSGAYSSVYKITAERSGRVDTAAMKVEPIVPSENAMRDEERKKRSIELKRELVINESNIMHKLKHCPNIVAYEDESFFDLVIDGKVEGCYFCLRMEYLSCLGDLLKRRMFRAAHHVLSRHGIIRFIIHISRNRRIRQDASQEGGKTAKYRKPYVPVMARDFFQFRLFRLFFRTL